MAFRQTSQVHLVMTVLEDSMMVYGVGEYDLLDLIWKAGSRCFRVEISERRLARD